MRKTFQQSNYDVAFEFLGLGDGLNFSRKFAPEEVDDNIAQLRQVHGAISSTRMLVEQNYAVSISPGSGNIEIAAAALITTHLDDALLLLPADCIPIILASSDSPVVALIHGGRRELDSGIIERTLHVMREQCGAVADKLTAYLGPGIKQSSYRLPQSVAATLQHSGWAPFTKHDTDTILLDTFGFAIHELERLGVHAGAIEVSQVDTATSPDYFSYYGQTRLGQPAGANGCAIIAIAR